MRHVPGGHAPQGHADRLRVRQLPGRRAQPARRDERDELVLEPGRQGAPVCSTCPGNRDAARATCLVGTHRKDTQIDCACANYPAGEHNPHAATSATSGRTSCDRCAVNTCGTRAGFFKAYMGRRTGYLEKNRRADDALPQVRLGADFIKDNLIY
jgi:hypothetical protein